MGYTELKVLTLGIPSQTHNLYMRKLKLKEGKSLAWPNRELNLEARSMGHSTAPATHEHLLVHRSGFGDHESQSSSFSLCM